MCISTVCLCMRHGRESWTLANAIVADGSIKAKILKLAKFTQSSSLTNC